MAVVAQASPKPEIGPLPALAVTLTPTKTLTPLFTLTLIRSYPNLDSQASVASKARLGGNFDPPYLLAVQSGATIFARKAKAPLSKLGLL